MSEVRCRLLDGCHEKAKNERFTAADSRCRVNFKYENFKSSLGRLPQNIAPKSVPHVQHEYFPRSTNQIIDLWRCRRRFLVMTVTTRTIKVTKTTIIKATRAMMLQMATRAHLCHLNHCFFFFSYFQISVGALYYQAQIDLHDHSDSDDDTAIVVSLPRMPQPEKLDIKSCEQFLLELFEQWMSLYIQPKTPLALISEATKAVSCGLLSVNQ